MGIVRGAGKMPPNPPPKPTGIIKQRCPHCGAPDQDWTCRYCRKTTSVRPLPSEPFGMETETRGTPPDTGRWSRA